MLRCFFTPILQSLCKKGERKKDRQRERKDTEIQRQQGMSLFCERGVKKARKKAIDRKENALKMEEKMAAKRKERKRIVGCQKQTKEKKKKTE